MGDATVWTGENRRTSGGGISKKTRGLSRKDAEKRVAVVAAELGITKRIVSAALAGDTKKKE